jgi:hypothetical protein
VNVLRGCTFAQMKRTSTSNDSSGSGPGHEHEQGILLSEEGKPTMLDEDSRNPPKARRIESDLLEGEPTQKSGE